MSFLSWTATSDAAGFVLVDPDLRAAGGPCNVFAVGDVAASANDPRPKAGVFAVRQGPVLAGNLRRRVCTKSPCCTCLGRVTRQRVLNWAS